MLTKERAIFLAFCLSISIILFILMGLMIEIISETNYPDHGKCLEMEILEGESVSLIPLPIPDEDNIFLIKTDQHICVRWENETG